MALGDSPKPLTEDVVKREPLKISPTFMEWVADGNAEQVMMSRGIAGVIYEVPENFTLFITSASLSLSSETGIVGGTANARISILPDLMILAINFKEVNNVDQTSSIANSFPMPLKVNAKQSVNLSIVSTAATAMATIQGFLLPRKISIR